MSETLKQATEAAAARVDAAYSAVEAKGGTRPSDANLSNLPGAIASIVSPHGLIWSKEPISLADAIINNKQLVEIYAEDVYELNPYAFLSTQYITNKLKKINLPNVLDLAGSAFAYQASLTDAIFAGANIIRNSCFSNCSALVNTDFRNVTKIEGNSNFVGCISLVEVNFPSLTTYSYSDGSFQGCTNLEKIHAPQLKLLEGTAFTVPNCPNLIDIEVGEFYKSFTLVTWNPTNVLADATKKAQLLKNIREHIAEKISKTATATITFSAAVGAAIDADTETKEAFPAGWTILY